MLKLFLDVIHLHVVSPYSLAIGVKYISFHSTLNELIWLRNWLLLMTTFGPDCIKTQKFQIRIRWHYIFSSIKYVIRLLCPIKYNFGEQIC